MPDSNARDSWDIAYDELLEVVRPPAPNEPLGPEEALKDKWLEEMGEALAPDIYPLMIAPLEFHIFLGDDHPSWDQKLGAHSKFYDRLKARRVDCDEAYRRLADFRHESPSARPKHWPLALDTTADIRQRVLASKPVVSCFYRGVTPELLTLALMEGLYEHIDMFWPLPSHAMLDLCAHTIIGCSQRGDTSFIRFDCSFDSLSVHGYPIDRADVAQPLLASSALLGQVNL